MPNCALLICTYTTHTLYLRISTLIEAGSLCVKVGRLHLTLSDSLEIYTTNTYHVISAKFQFHNNARCNVLTLYNLSLFPQIFHYGGHIEFASTNTTNILLDWYDKNIKFGTIFLERCVNSTLESKVAYLLSHYVDCFYNFV